ncbi:MAG: hypothetical protein ACRCYU_04855 [Nocardioides sp.]
MAEFESMLSGGHPNSLGRTTEVVDAVVADRSRLRELLDCYDSADAVVRLRTSSALKRVEAAQHDWLTPHLDEFIDKIGALDQASAQWTLAQLFGRYDTDMSSRQRGRAQAVLQRNLATHQDWIVLNHTIETLSRWALNDADLRAWLRPHLERLAREPRRSVANRASKKLRLLYRT